MRNILVPCDQGLFVVNRHDSHPWSITSHLQDHGSSNTVEADMSIKLLKQVSQPIVIDVGANLGTYTTWLARFAARQGGSVYAFEPQRIVFQLLCGNLALNNIFNVQAEQLALGASETTLWQAEADYDHSGSSFGNFDLDGACDGYKLNPSQRTRINVTTLDAYVSRNEIEKIDFVKVDVEGYELNVLEGAWQSIQRWRPHMILEHLKVPGGIPSLQAKLAPLGYNLFVCDTNILATQLKEIPSE
jgi:FkbM family methyltransferase